MIRCPNGDTLPGWRDFERVFAERYCGAAPENKEIFDVVVQDDDKPKTTYGLSVKSKKLTRRSAIKDLDDDGRVYMELANSPAKFWDSLRAVGITENDWGSDGTASGIGDRVIDTVRTWHHAGGKLFEKANAGLKLDVEMSVFLVISYADERPDRPREYQIHAFDLDFPEGIEWEYLPPYKGLIRCLRGFDPDGSSEALVDWYPFSGGQLKYYPRACRARHKSPRFSLSVRPPVQRIEEKAMSYWPELWPED